jgi:hypothetical protein
MKDILTAFKMVLSLLLKKEDDCKTPARKAAKAFQTTLTLLQPVSSNSQLASRHLTELASPYSEVLDRSTLYVEIVRKVSFRYIKLHR